MTTSTTILRIRRALAGALSALLLAPAAPVAADNEIGRRTSVGNGFVRRHYEYDAQGRVRREVHVLDHVSFVYTRTFGYPAGSVAGPGTVLRTLTFPDGEVVTYGYDADGEIDTVTAGGQPVVKGIARNARGQMTDVVYGNDARTLRRYNEGGDLRLNLIKSCFGPISADDCQSSGTPFQAYTYGYDPNGNVKSVTDQVIQGTYSSTYAYDSLDQLVSRTSAGGTSTYGYDDVGNLVSKEGVSQSYGTGQCGSGRRGPHALALSGGDCYSYDSNGNVVSSSSGLSLGWNAEDMATQVTQGASQYEKSFLGNSLWKKTEGSLTTYYLPSLRREGTQNRKYYGAFAERSAEDGQLRFYHPDHLGSSTVMTGPGAILAHRSAFKPYGADVDAGGGGFVPKLRFNLKEKELALYDYGARLYSPATGRWLSPDTRLDDGLNRYAYASNNPVLFTDPTGHQSRRAPSLIWLGDLGSVEVVAQDPFGLRGFPYPPAEIGPVSMNWPTGKDWARAGLEAVGIVLPFVTWNIDPDDPTTGKQMLFDTATMLPAGFLVKVFRRGGRIVYGGLDALGRATGVEATITRDMIGTGSKASKRIRPPGFAGGPGHHRGHLYGGQLGGTGKDARNLVTMFADANTPFMRDFENEIRAAVEAGETINYRVTPIYNGVQPIPIGITMEASGNRGYHLIMTVLNRP